jgi:hypothetical protein
MSYDDMTDYKDSTYVYNENNGLRVGKIEDYAILKRADVDNNKTNWGMSQTSKLLPSLDHDFPNEDGSWANFNTTEQAQHWDRTDCGNLQNLDYYPTTDTIESYTTTWSISVPPGFSVSGTVDHKQIKRDIEYQSNQDVRALYDYVDTSQTYAAYDKDTVPVLQSSWKTDRPSTGDQIAPSYIFGKFTETDDYASDPYATESDSLFNMFYEGEIDDV